MDVQNKEYLKGKRMAKQMYFAGFKNIEIQKEINIDRYKLDRWIDEWVAQKKKVYENRTKDRLEYIRNVELELFNELKKVKRNNKYINELTNNYCRFVV